MYCLSLINHAPGLSGRRLWLDGPFGRLSVQPSWYSHVVVVCGGIGVTPFLPLLDELLAIRTERRPHIWFIWSMRHRVLLEHFEERVTGYARAGVDCSFHLTERGKADSRSMTPHQPPSDRAPDGESCAAPRTTRPDLGAVFNSVAAHYGAHHSDHTDAGRKTQVGCALFSCGPESLTTAAAEAAAMHSAAMPVDTHTEVFLF